MKETKKVLHKLLTKMWEKNHILQMKILHGKKSSLNKTIIENGKQKNLENVNIEISDYKLCFHFSF